MKYPICCITCNIIPSLTCNSILKNLLYYLQGNTWCVVLPARKYPMCRITCNEIPDVSYYLQWNTRCVVLPARKYPMCRITCKEIPDVSYYLQGNTRCVVLPARKYPMCRITCKEIPDVSYYLQGNTRCAVLPAMNPALPGILYWIFRVVLPAIQYVSYLSPTAALQWFRMFVCFLEKTLKLFIQDYAWLRCWQLDVDKVTLFMKDG